ncbi:MAG TPA: hypothetical protein VEX35_01755 [Allosphingosinicella sp.]|nr:hypothetical protein [Allosphingosinicella sp.]
MRRLLIPGVALGFATMACAAATRPGPSRPISGNARQPGETGASARPGQAGRVQVVRRDRFRTGPNTGICIETRMDPEVRPRIEASGEHVDLAGLTADPVEQIHERFSALGIGSWIDGGQRLRVFAYIEMSGDSSCLTRPDTILIRQHVAAAGPAGYRVSIEARQGDRRYSASLTRRHTIVLPHGRRLGLAMDADRLPGLATPFWDVARDIHRLSAPLIDHILAGAGS